jgi:hypothetical protein
LDAGNVSSYSGSGNTWTDISGFGNSPVFSSAPIWVSSGSSSYFVSNDNKSAQTPGNSNGVPLGTSSWTVSVWLLQTTYAGGQRGQMGWGNNTVAVSSMKSDVSATTFNIIEMRGGTNDRPAVVTPTNQWMNVVFTNSVTGSPSNQKFGYLNGVLTASGSSTTITTTNGPFYAMRSAEGNSFPGNMAIIKVWAGILSPSQVRDEYNTYRNRYGLPPAT